MDIYKKNLQALKNVDIQLYKELLTIETNNQFEVFLTTEDVSNANIINIQNYIPMYEGEASLEIQESLKKFQQFDNYPILYFFGLGNGSFYKKLLQNKKHQSVIVIEPELELIYIALNLVDFSTEILEGRIIIKLSRMVNKEYFIEYMSGKIKFFLRVYDFHIHSKYYDLYKNEIDRVNKNILEAFRYTMYILGNCADDSLIGFEHNLKNIPLMLQTPTLKELIENVYKRKSAVIVSTGPSLAKQLTLLKSVQDYITILCIDASFPILVKEGIKPDIVFSIERVPATGSFYKNTAKKAHENVIFSLATVCHNETINNIYGEKSFFMRNDTYNTFFGFDDYGYLGGGQSAANFAFDFADKAKFENITFIGQDLAYGQDGASHSRDHIFGEDEVKNDKIIGYVEAYGGKGHVPTTTVWKAFLNSLILQISSASTSVFNSTEGGARIPGTVEIKFTEFCEKFVSKDIKKELISLHKPLEKNIKENLEQYKLKKMEIEKIGKSMHKRSKKLYNEFQDFLLKIKDYSDEMILFQITDSKLDFYREELRKVKNKYNDEKFTMVYGSLLNAYIINFEYEVAEVYVMRENTELAKKKKKIAWIRVHKEWLYRVFTNIEAALKILEKY